MASEAFRKIQVGEETTRGTLVAADKKWIGTITMTPDITKHFPAEDRGSLAMNRRINELSKITRFAYNADASYEQIIDLFHMGIKGNISPTTPGSGEARLWTFTPALTATNAQDAFTIEYGDDTQEWESGFCMVESIDIAFTMNEITSIVANIFGRSTAKSTFTGSLTDPTITEIVSNKLKVYIDGTWANLGSTQKAGLVTGGSISIPTGLTPVWKADGSLDFNSFSEQKRAITVSLDMALGTDYVTEYDAFAAADGGTARAIRLQWDGPAFDSPDNGLARLLRFDMFGYYTAAPEHFGVVDGLNITTLEFQTFEDAVGPNEFSIVVQNNLTTI